MFPTEEIEYCSHYKNGNKHHEQAMMPEYNLCVSRMYNKKGKCIEDYIFATGPYNGIVFFLRKSTQSFFLFSRNDNVTHGIAIVMPTTNKSWFIKIIDRWKRLF